LKSTVLKKKICLLGNFGVGKTSLIRRFVLNTFEDNYLSTIGVKVSKKDILSLKTNNGTVDLQLLIWDIEGVNKNSTVTEKYYTGASGGILVSDLSREDTIESLPVIRESFSRINPHAKIVIVGNKTDLFQKKPTSRINSLTKLAQSLNCEFYLTSAKDGSSVEACFNHLSKLLIGP